jgi:predicted N-acetyltransferase YhbS
MEASMVTITPEVATDLPVREALLDRAFGKRERRRKTSERLREGRLPAEGLAFAARNSRGRLIGMLLGPLAVDCAYQRHGIGARLMLHGLAEAKRLGHKAVLLVGDEPYYGRFGFSRETAEGLSMPGPIELKRFLGLELVPDALRDAEGLVESDARMTPNEATESVRMSA